MYGEFILEVVRESQSKQKNSVLRILNEEFKCRIIEIGTKWLIPNRIKSNKKTKKNGA